ncbi:WD40 repeat domain-containing protein [Chamaesiphon minutus]|uniref:WD40 repeat-containing protein n=1 Tax=Chamaesiphon minutus (strain ATCC 27169 / PCC 6605) TaxID=1173020 RepID=K9UI14_CHAP6|nr:WD40 repeat domain-containing protein [Chamaesiphon minutus]AFY93829.1 WD40 repeat-containing protein [Chamaesiphon minutus PCC 6605]
MLDAIVHNLEQSNHIARIKKLVFCACTNNWSNEAQQLSTVKFKSCIQQLRDRHASIVELKYLLYRIVIRLNHSTNYYTVANLLCQEMEPLYVDSAEGVGAEDRANSTLTGRSPTAVWAKEVIFTVEEIQSGAVLQVEMVVLAANRQLLNQTVVTLPDLVQMHERYQEWQSRYRRLDPQNHRLLSNKAVSLVPERINDCLDAGAMLQANLHQWYGSPGFQTIRERLATTVDPELEIETIVRSRSKALLKLPWNSIWQPLLDRYPLSEVNISLIPTISESSTIDEQLKVSVLSVLTSAQGIKIDRSKEYLDALPYTKSEFVVAPSHQDFVNLVTQKSWSVLFFSSYISGYLPNNRIYINHHDTISIAEFKYRIRIAVQRGLKLLILNCGEGLELAGELVDLQIPNLVVLREAVQDQVAQEFVKLFLKAFSSGKSLQLAVRDARERLQAIEKVVPSASCLPIVCQQIATPASSWNRLAQITLDKPLELLGLSQNWTEAEATGMMGQADLEMVMLEPSVDRQIAYDRLELIHQLSGYYSEVYSLAFSNDGQWLVSGHGDITHVDDAIKVWRLLDGKLIHNLLGHSHWVYGLCLSADNETIISGSLDGTVQWWQLTTGVKLPQLLDHKSAVNAISLASDGQRLVTGGNDAAIKIWQPQNGLLIHQCQGHLQNVACLATHSAAQLIASGSSDYTVRLWHLQEGRLLKTILGHSGRISGVAITPDGKKVVSASHDCTIKIWEVATGNLINSLTGHSKPIGCVAISPDGQTIVSGGDDRTVNIWNLSDGKLLHTLPDRERPILSVAISADNCTIATGSYGEIQVWRVPAT